MAERKEDYITPSAEGQPSTRPGPQGDANEGKERVLFQSVSQGAGAAASHSASVEIGIIESIQLENFMCHAKLGPVKFGSGVNFVVGQMGKSALLTALVVGLGGQALGSSLREFVKYGELSANISITLRNRGEEAFKSDLYGDSITVQQCISVNGSASYRLKDHAGSLVCSEKAELRAILDHFNIRVDNPMSILQQEMGRQLLHTTNDGDRYKFFLKVAQLEEMNDDYLRILEKKAWTQNQIEQGEALLWELNCRVRDIEKRFQSMVASRRRVEELKVEIAWAVVNESERQIEDMITNINIGDQHTIRLNQELEACRQKFNEAAKKFKDIQQNLYQLNKEASALETKCVEAKEDVNRKDKAYKKAEVLYDASQNELKELQGKAKEHCNQIEDLKKNIEQEKSEKQEKIFTLRENIKNFQDQEDSLVQVMGHLQQAIQKDNEEYSRLREEVSNIQKILNDEQQQLNRLKDCKTDPLKLFEPQMTALLEAVDNTHRQGCFTCKPIGPLGAYIRLRDLELALAVESCLKGLLFAFCCNNPKDEEVLQGLMEKFYPPSSPRPQIIVAPFQCEVHDVTHKAAFHPEYPTVLTALEISEAVVANALIDMRGIESVLLIKNNSLARRVMQAQRPPKNCSEVFTADGDQVLERRYYSCEKLRPTYLIDVEIEIIHVEKEIENKMARLSVYQQHACTLENDIRKNQEILKNHDLHLKEIQMRVTKINMEIRDLEKEENQPGDISILEKEAQEIKKLMTEVEEKVKMRKEEMKNLRKQKMVAEQRHENIKIEMCQISESTESLNQELNNAGLEIDTEKRYMLHYQDWLKQHLNSLQVTKEELSMKERNLEIELAQAKYLCPERKEIKETPSVLEETVSLLKQKIASENRIYGSREEIIQQYQKVRERHQGLDVKVKNLKKCMKSLDETSQQKYEILQQFRRGFALRCKLYFDNLLSQWAYSGEMRFDHKNETLSIRVQSKEGNKAASADIQFLAGSENSFSNFVFILTLWSITESPFRCLDAFDMYLDPVSRRIAMDMILRIAQSQQYQQFILLTPQNMSVLPINPLARIFILPDAESGQTTLPFRAIRQGAED